MIRIRRYLYPYLFFFTASVILLFAQANLDLALPDYLSQIVNVGIQQTGVESPIPTAMRQETLDRVLLFADEEAQTQISNAYTLVEPGNADYDQALETYPLLADEPLYILQDITDEEGELLRTSMAQSLLVVSGIETAMEDPEAAAAQFGGDAQGFDLSQLPEGTDLFAMMGLLPATQREEMSAGMQEQLAALGDTAVEQAAILRVQSEYEALGVDIGALQNEYVINTGVIMLAVTLLSAAASIAVGYFSARIAAGLGRDLRRDVFRKVESFSSVEFDKIPTASLITRSTNDITQVQNITVFVVRLAFYAPILGIGGVIRAIDKSPDMWWTIALAVLVLLGITITIIIIALPKFRIVQKLVDRLNLVSRENLSGMLVIRAFNMQSFEENRFDKANLDLTANNLFIARIMALLMPLMMFILNALSILIIWVGAQQVGAANIQVGDMMAFLQYAMQIVFAFLMLTMLFIMLPRAVVSADRIADVLEIDPAIDDPAKPKTLNGAFKGRVEFKNVSFQYPGAEGKVLHDINFVAKPGETTALIGSTGSGKSTIATLIPRFYDVSEGAVTIDGIDIREVTQHDLRDKIGYVPQKGMLFSGTIGSNLRYGDEKLPKPKSWRRLALPKRVSLSLKSQTDSNPKSHRVAPTFPVGNANVFPSPVPW